MSRKAPGFAEERQAAFDGAPWPEEGVLPAAPASDSDMDARLKIGPGGRVVIPADMRAALGVAEGDTLLASVVDGEMRLISMPMAIRRAQAIVRAYIPAGGPSLVDELIADRRQEAEDERTGRR
jgi:AbrB family looped-hinge helix DNA binding protein